MIEPVTWTVVGLSALLFVVAVVYAWRDRLIDDRLLLLLALIELGLVVQLVVGLFGLGQVDEDTEQATFAAYLVSLPLIPVGTGLLAIKEKTRWAMGSLAVGAFAVAVMTARCLQIWTLHA
ncbi:hypothetical protein ACK8HX_02510 [Oryzobacter sp. R7]|uniref:hypothetical protein n=1 Tax=Oryzobacter faecalis TaxID=3388656 RepID=UPI00398C9E73